MTPCRAKHYMRAGRQQRRTGSERRRLQRSRTARRTETVTLIYADGLGHSRFLATLLTHLGKEAVVVRNPLEAIVRLQDDKTSIDAALVPLQHVNFNMAAFCSFLKDEHPHVKRIGFSSENSVSTDPRSIHSYHCEEILGPPEQEMDLVDDLKRLVDLPALQD